MAIDRYGDFGLGEEMLQRAREENGPLLNEARQQELQRLLKGKYMMTGPEIQDCVESINQCVSAQGAHIKSVIDEALPSKMKHSAKMEIQTAILQMVDEAVKERQKPAADNKEISVTAAKPAAQSHKL
jgi:siderophore synthetase component